MSDKRHETKEIDYSIVDTGPLYVDPSYKEAGYHYLLPTNRPGEIEYYKRLGFEVVETFDSNISAGSDKSHKSSPLGSAVTIQSRCGAQHILMKCPLELWDKYQKFQQDRNRRQTEALGHVDNIPQTSLYGSVTIGDKKL